MISLIGSLNEAWTQVRLSKVRVFISLMNVAVAVAVMASVIAFGRVVVQAQVEELEYYSGRPGTINISVTEKDPSAQTDPGAEFDPALEPDGFFYGYGGGGVFMEPMPGQRDDGDGEQASKFTQKLLTEWDALVKRYDIRYASAVMQNYSHVLIEDGLLPVELKVVDQPYAEMHRLVTDQGRWFDASDVQKLAPRVVITHGLAEALGALKKDGPVTLSLGKTNRVRAVVVGILPQRDFEMPGLFMLRQSYEAMPNKEPGGQYGFEVWVDPSTVPQAQAQIKATLNGKFGKDSTQAYAMDSSGVFNTKEGLTKVVGAIGVVILVLGGLSLINISVVTVRARIHEIGIRRSLGATSTRVFIAIFLESVVATFVAGLVGVTMAVLAAPHIPYDRFEVYVQDVPPFPLDAAMVGLLSATAIGALAGIIPALIAVRVKPIDAIRY
ncbi:ABC transporter permease [Buchananella felis]|uniref:ABC transporter permease n=1 Tax=Buchananella felis TaxID=3231492 RepID=UPI003529A686